MTRPSIADGVHVGLLRVRAHCVFTWVLTAETDNRHVEHCARHCDACVAELRRLGYRLVPVPTPRSEPEKPAPHL